MEIKAKYSFTKWETKGPLDQTYVCTDDGEEFYILGHVKVEEINILELQGKHGAYCWLVESTEARIGMYSIHNSGF